MKYFLSIIILSGMIGCAPRLHSSWTKPNYQATRFAKIVVIGVSQDLTARNAFEKKAVQLLKEKGINAVPGVEVFPPDQKVSRKDTSKIRQILQNHQLDGVITMSLLKSEQSKKYVSGDPANVADAYGNFKGYYYQTYQQVSKTGYYVNEKAYLIEAAFYDLKQRPVPGKSRMVWSGQSTLINPSCVQTAAAEFTKKMVFSLLKTPVVLPNND
ncbi:hypothetical protein [uncultured Microscilla sp.]|uniref:hypothetical protein n=1 Tax=uncultured Microscilla sp. TaxID=432653 RepID=UPI00262630F7|nr:hypothetical protein [uncultured Microscilla sp.]